MIEKKSFSELLGEAPMATGEKTVTLTGALSRSADPGKFVLTMGDNQTVTLDVDAVKQYKVLSGMVGQMIVEVEVDRDKVPNAAAIASAGSPSQHLTIEARDITSPMSDRTLTSPVLDYFTVPIFDFHTVPIIDNPIYKNIIENTGTIQENVIDPGNYVDPGVMAAQAGIAPFALATPHQAPQGMFAGMPTSPNLFRTSPIWDRQTVTWVDKVPIADITGHFPYPD